MEYELALISKAELARHYHQPLSEIRALDEFDIDILTRWLQITMDIQKSK